MANANTRTTLFDNGDFSLYAQLSPVASPEDGYALTITSQRQESRNPHEEQVKFFACLERGDDCNSTQGTRRTEPDRASLM